LRSRRDDDTDVYNQDDNHNVYDDRGRGGEGGGGAAGEYTTDEVQSPVASDAQDNGQEDGGIDGGCMQPSSSTGRKALRKKQSWHVDIDEGVVAEAWCAWGTDGISAGRTETTDGKNYLLPESFDLSLMLTNPTWTFRLRLLPPLTMKVTKMLWRPQH